MQLLVKGLVAAIAARNKLSIKKTRETEQEIFKGSKEIFDKMKTIGGFFVIHLYLPIHLSIHLSIYLSI